MNTLPKPYGVKSIKQMRDDTRAKIGPSPVVTINKADTLDYFMVKVDPIMADCVTRLLYLQPNDVVNELITYLELRKSLEGTNEVIPPGIPDKLGKTKASHKLFLATRISPILSYLMNKIAYDKPGDVITFILNCLKTLPKDFDNNNNNINNSARKIRPSTAVVRSPQKDDNYAIDARPTTAPQTRIDTDDIENDEQDIQQQTSSTNDNHDVVSKTKVEFETEEIISITKQGTNA